MQAPARSRTDIVLPDFLGPFVGLLASRDAHAAHLRFLLERAVRLASQCAPPILCPERPPVMQPELIEIQVCSRDLPLDWVLSESTREEMKNELDNPDPRVSCGNRAKIDHIVRLLGH